MGSMMSLGLEFMRTRWGVIRRKKQRVNQRYGKSIDNANLKVKIKINTQL